MSRPDRIVDLKAYIRYQHAEGWDIHAPICQNCSDGEGVLVLLCFYPQTPISSRHYTCPFCNTKQPAGPIINET